MSPDYQRATKRRKFIDNSRLMFPANHNFFFPEATEWGAHVGQDNQGDVITPVCLLP